MKRFNQNLNIKKLTGIALAGVIGFSSFGFLETNVQAAENTNYAYTNKMMKVENMSLKQLQELIQQKNAPFINQVKIFINKHFNESEFLWEKISNQLKIDIVNLLEGDKKDYSRKVDVIIKKYFKEIPSILKLASSGFVKDLIKLLDYLPN